MAKDIRSRAEEPEDGHPGLSRLSILRTIWKRKVLIVAAWIVFTAGAVAVVRLLPVVYMAEAVVLIDSQKIPEKFVSATVADEAQDRIASIRQMLLSGGELKKIIDDFGLYREESKTHVEEEILDMMRNNISVTLDSAGLKSSTSGNAINTARPGAFRIGYQGSDPALVMRVANRLTDLYLEQNMKTREGQAAGTSGFLESELEEAKRRLDELEAAVSRYKLQHNGELPQQEQSISAALSRLQTELEVNRDAINRAQQTRVILQGSLSALQATESAQTSAWQQQLRPKESSAGSLVADDPGVAQQGTTLKILEDRLEVLRGRYSENHPDVAALRDQITRVKRLEEQRRAANAGAAVADPNPAATTRTQTPPPELARVRQQVAGIQAQILASDKELESRGTEQQRILRDLGLYQRRLERLPVREQEMAQITRDYEISKDNYKTLLDKRTAAEMSLNMERGQQSERFIILDRAQIPAKPIKPDRPRLYAVGAVAGLLLALLLGFGIELRQNVLLGEWELPAGTLVLARLPYIVVSVRPGEAKPKSRGWFSRRKELADSSVSLLLAALTVASVSTFVGRF